MKKVLSIVLAGLMLSTVALASESYNKDEKYAPGTVIIIESSDFPGDCDYLNTDNYSLRSVSYEAGKSYVDSVELAEDDDDDELVVTLKKDSSMDRYKDVEFTVRLRGRRSSIDDAEQTFRFQVGNEVHEVYIEEDGYIDGDALKPGAINKFVPGDKNWPYGTLEFSPNGDVDISVKVFEDEEIYYNVDEDTNKTVLKNNIDSNCDISFINFNGMEFERQATVYFYWPDEDGYIYEISSSGKLTQAPVKWSDDSDCWVLKTSELGAFALSDGRLKASSSASSSESQEESSSSSSYQPGDYVPNPSTGASNVGAAMAAVGLVVLASLGALSLKNKK